MKSVSTSMRTRYILYLLVLICMLLIGTAYFLFGHNVHIVLVDSTGIYFTYLGVPFLLK